MFETKKLARAGIIASIYVILSFIIQTGSGPVQIRVAEGLCLLPLIYIEAIPAVTIGCLIVNILYGCTVTDIIIGSIITFISAVCTYYFGKKIIKRPLKIFVGGLFPVLLNAIFLPIIWILYSPNTQEAYILQVLFMLLSESLSVYIMGTFLVCQIQKMIVHGAEFLNTEGVSAKKSNDKNEGLK